MLDSVKLFTISTSVTLATDKNNSFDSLDIWNKSPNCASLLEGTITTELTAPLRDWWINAASSVK